MTSGWQGPGGAGPSGGPPPWGPGPYGWGPGTQGPGTPGPGTPGSGAPGYGQPYGSPYGWAPPPPAAPEPAGPRPRVVVAAIAAWTLSLVCALIGSLWSLSHLDEQLDDARQRYGSGNAVLDDSGFLHTVTVVAAVFGLVWLAVYAAFLVFAWQGRNWARIVLWVLGGLGMFGFIGLVGASPGRAALLVVQLLLTLVAIVLLALKPSNDWFRRRGQELATRRR